MDVVEYIEKLKEETDKVFKLTVENKHIYMQTAGELISSLSEWYKELKVVPNSIMLKNAIEEIEVSILNVSLGLYRSGYISLRLALEMLAGFVYFSTNNLAYREWLLGSRDLVWSELSCSDNGVLSQRFINAYFCDMQSLQNSLIDKMKSLYRKLSENVHGNSHTWELNKTKLNYSINEKDTYNKYLCDFKEIVGYLLCVRFLKSIDDDKRDLFISDDMRHEESIRKVIGAPI